MLAEVLGPRGDQEGFDEALWVGRVLVEAPAHGAVPTTDDAHVLHDLDEGALVLGGHAVVDGDQDRAAVGVAHPDSSGDSAATDGRRSTRGCSSGQNSAALMPAHSSTPAAPKATGRPN